MGVSRELAACDAAKQVPRKVKQQPKQLFLLQGPTVSKEKGGETLCIGV